MGSVPIFLRVERRGRGRLAVAQPAGVAQCAERPGFADFASVHLRNWKRDAASGSWSSPAAARRSAPAATSSRMEQAAKMTKARSKAEAGRFAKLLYRMHTYPKPLIARVHGPAFAGGMGLAAACDLVVAAEEAEFCLPEVRIGLVPAMISPYLVRAMGEQQARRYILTGERLARARSAPHRLRARVRAGGASSMRAWKSSRRSSRSAGPEALARSKKLLTQGRRRRRSRRGSVSAPPRCWPKRAPATRRARASAPSSKSAGRNGARDTQCMARGVFALRRRGAARRRHPCRGRARPGGCRITPSARLRSAGCHAGESAARGGRARRGARVAARGAASRALESACSWNSARASMRCRRAAASQRARSGGARGLRDSLAG